MFYIFGDFIMTKIPLCLLSSILFLIATSASAQVTFTDVTAAVGLPLFEGIPYMAANWGDYDNDGDADLLLIGGLGPGLGIGLYCNEGDRGFVDVTQTVGITEEAIASWATIFLDVDNDGDLDLFVGDHSYRSVGHSLYRNNGDGTFLDFSQSTGLKKATGTWSDGAVSFDYDGDGLLDIYTTHHRPNFLGLSGSFLNSLYHNEGNGRFKEIATELGLDKPEHSDGIALGDYDNDGDLDIFITSPAVPSWGVEEVEQEMTLYRNDGDGIFVDVAQEVGLQAKNSPSEAFFWDYDNDGDLDLFTQSAETNDVDDINILYRNNAGSTFTDVTKSAGIELINNSGYGADYGDYDNDGWLDLCVTYNKLSTLLYHNNKDGTFTEIAKASGIGGTNSGTTSFVDYDNDGNLDIFIAPGTGTTALYRNGGTDNHWLQLKLVGVQSNRDAIGARVKVRAGNLSMLRKIAGSSAIGSQQNRLPIHFGLGLNSQADVIEIRWPSGILQTLTNIPVDGRFTINELEGIQVVVYGVFPAAAEPKGGTPVQIQGEYFLPGSRVFFGGVEASNVRLVSPSLITSVTPTSARGLVNVEVVHPDGKRGILKSGFRYTTLQVIKITPESGPVAGGTTVQIEGFGFQQETQVQISLNPLVDIFWTPTSIRGNIPPGMPGKVDILVTNPDGERVVLPGAFTYILPPKIKKIYSVFVPLGGGGEVEIRGTGFTNKSSVSIGGTICQSVEFIDADRLNVSTPQILDLGPQDVVVINSDGQRAVLSDGVTVLAPIKIKSVEPVSGGLAGGTKVTIVGESIVPFKPPFGAERNYPSRFVEGVKVFIGEERAYDVTVQSDHIITAITPPNTSGAKDVEVVNPDGQKDTLENAFFYNPLPQITRVIPDNGRLVGSTKIAIRGSGFLSGAKVLIGNVDENSFATASEVQVVSDALVMALTPSGEPGPKDVVVRNPDRQDVVLREGFTYNPMPTIRSISPDHGPISGGTKLLIEGKGFLQGAKVIVGKRPATTEVKSDTMIEAVTPANPQGVFDVRVTNPDTQIAVKPKGFISVGEVAYNYPNPFRASQGTTFRYVTNERVDFIKVQIFNLGGVPIGVVGQAGSNEVRWYDASVHAGLYVYRMDVRLAGGNTKMFKRALEVYK